MTDGDSRPHRSADQGWIGVLPDPAPGLVDVTFLEAPIPPQLLHFFVGSFSQLGYFCIPSADANVWLPELGLVHDLDIVKIRLIFLCVVHIHLLSRLLFVLNHLINGFIKLLFSCII